MNLLKNQLRALTQQAIIAAQTTAFNRVYSPRDYKLWDGLYPCVQVKTPQQQRQSLGKSGTPHFNTVVSVVVIATVQADTEDEAEEQLEFLENQIEKAVITNFEILDAIEQFETVQTEQVVTSEGSQHIGQVQLVFNMQSYEEFNPTDEMALEPLDAFNVHVDTIYPYDATGTYTNPAFPDSVQPAPRTRGIDGRDEGYLELDVSE